METGNLDSEHSEDVMRPPHAVRSKRKRGSSKGKGYVNYKYHGIDLRKTLWLCMGNQCSSSLYG